MDYQMDYQTRLARRTRKMNVNAIREILKAASQPGIISLAGGLPAPESFPTEIMAELAAKVLDKYGAAALQYGPTEGFDPLREALARWLGTQNMTTRQEDILISSGSQGALDMVAKVLVAKGDRVAVESPTYLGALHAFTPYEPEYVALETDAHGPTPQGLRRVLRQQRVKFIYLVPTFQNPTGGTIPLFRRQEIAAEIRGADALLIEDDPYSTLRYAGESLPAIKTLAPDHVVYLGTLSKVLAPGLRVGYCIPPASLKKWLVIAKQGVDLHTGSLSQALAAEYISGGYLERHLPKIISLYAPRCRAMLNALEKYFPRDFSWSRPQGGMFVWGRGTAGLDTEALYAEALKERIAFVPGRYFHVSAHEGRETLRLNFTMNDTERIETAIRRLGALFHRHCEAKARKRSIPNQWPRSMGPQALLQPYGGIGRAVSSEGEI